MGSGLFKATFTFHNLPPSRQRGPVIAKLLSKIQAQKFPEWLVKAPCPPGRSLCTVLGCGGSAAEVSILDIQLGTSLDQNLKDGYVALESSQVGSCPAHLVAGVDISTMLQKVDDAQEGPLLPCQVERNPARLTSNIGVGPTL